MSTTTSRPDPASTLAGALHQAAQTDPERGVTVFDGRGRTSSRRTYPEIRDAALAAAGRWAALGVAPGDRVVISLPTSWPLLDAWLGAVLRGALPVAMAAPGAMGASDAHTHKVDHIVERLGARYVLSTETFGDQAKVLRAQHAAEAAIAASAFDGLAPTAYTAPEPEPDDVAFLQLTSGSTGLPRAVMIRNRSAVHNALASDHAIGLPLGGPMHTVAHSMVSWLPLNHDMGLVGCLFLSMICGFDLVLFPPTTFLARPRLWLEHLGQHGVAFTPAPNFGYQLCVERLAGKPLDGIDLRPWQAAMTGAEMIRPDTIAAFCERFGPVGFRPEAFRPCYGLAEGTLAVTFDLQGQGMRTRPVPAGAEASGSGLDEVVCVGEPIIDTTVRIVDSAGTAVPDGTVGEVRVSGPSVFAGYYNDPEATADGLRDGWLCTGDLGFVTDGELYLTGRIKDVLILRGHNVMPHELEWLAEGVTGGGGAARCGAFSVTRGNQGEEAVLVVEATTRDPETLATIGQDIRNRVGRALSLTLADLVFVRRGRIPKTTSGKVQRRQLRDLYLRGELDRM